MATIKKPVKKMQTGGTATKKPITLKPDYRNLQLARSYNNAQLGNKLNTPATKQDSTDYKTGFIRGVKGWKPSADRLKYEGEGEYQKMGRWEGQNAKKEALSKKKTGGKITKAKNGKSFPDLNKDGKVTRADILKGRGVIAQKGATVKKKTGMDAVKAVGKYVSTFGGATERDNPKQKDINIVKKLKETGNKVKNKLGLKSGGSVKKCKYGCK
jgi:hypothetical protein